MSEDKPRVIVSAAMRCRKTGNIICSVRHWDQTTHWHFPTVEEARKFHDEQGFIDNKYQFLTREEAWIVAEAAGQIRYRCGGDERNGGTLYSENLY